MRPEEYHSVNHCEMVEPISFVDESPYAKRVWIVTIMHSGTHYAFAHLKNMGYEHAEVQWRNPLALRLKFPCGPYQYIHTHIGIASEVHRIGATPVILTLRNPVEIFRSHVFRYAWHVDKFAPYVIQAFEDWDKIKMMYDCHIFQVDYHNQYREVVELGQWLGMDNWTYKEQENTIGSAIGKKPTIQQKILFANGKLDKARQDLYNNPPREILELATKHGY